MESILTSVKKMLGISEEYEHFDPEIIMHINSVLMVLTQIGIGPPEGFSIEDETSSWTDFVSDTTKLEAIKTYVYLRVRLIFDSSSLTGPIIESINRTINELEWRLNIIAESIQSE